MGGWSAHGQPVDQVHSMYRSRIRHLDLEKLRMSPDLRERPDFEDLPMRPSGQTTSRTNMVILAGVDKWLTVNQIGV